jgi:hypothetical protein
LSAQETRLWPVPSHSRAKRVPIVGGRINCDLSPLLGGRETAAAGSRLVAAETLRMSAYPLLAMVMAVLADAASALVILALASILFLTTMLLTMALLLRNRWDEMGRDGGTPARGPRRPPGAGNAPQRPRSTRRPEGR